MGAGRGDRDEEPHGDDGSDVLTGGLGNDILNGGAGDDLFSLSSGNFDLPRQSQGNDAIDTGCFIILQ